MPSFEEGKAYAAQEATFFNDGREEELVDFVTSRPRCRGSPTSVLEAIDDFARTRKYLMNVGDDKGRIIVDLIRETRPKTMVELGGYCGYSTILLADALREAGGEKLYSLERNVQFAQNIKALVQFAGLSDIVEVIVGPSSDGIQRLYDTGNVKHIDMMFLDHYKPAYTIDLKLCESLGLVGKGTVLAADNVITPGNPPYLKYVRSSVPQKKAALGQESKQDTENFDRRSAAQYGEVEILSIVARGNPNLIYESTLIDSFEPTGVPAQHFGLNVPETYHITSVADAMAQLYPAKTQAKRRNFIMKSIGLDDSIRADMTILPRPLTEDTRRYLTRLRPSMTRPFVLQQFINGTEYCTHSIIADGHVVAFAACPSAELLMHYIPLPPASNLSRAMQKYIEIFAKKMGHITGHLSIDFMLSNDDSESDPTKRLYPIECNPRAHTAVVLFADKSEGMVDAYLSVLSDEKKSNTVQRATFVSTATKGYFWIGHDIVTCFLLPLLSTMTAKADLRNLLTTWGEFWQHLAYLKDGTYEIWDPWPFWWLYCIYWPAMFLSTMITQQWWSRCNVSTTKMFGC
ncbi:MAG: hypothetical protein M1818_002761 [Claussenomyces sp. TS43310]|nr:MAG: hypothetical protein M1818_002761 [Claussenomyces sp. TS43310]